jgi:hypothetical protein
VVTTPSKHKHPPISLRLPEADRFWLLSHAEASGRPVNAIVADAVAAYRAALARPEQACLFGDGGTATRADGGTTA